MLNTCRFFVFTVFTLIFTGRSALADTIHVDTNATGAAHDGSSWCEAYLNLQDALVAAAVPGGSVDEIRVAGGVYKPDQGGGQLSADREATFQMISGVTIAGGYAGCGAPDPNKRDIAGYQTILSGDLTGDDVVVAVEDLFTEATRAENSYHVVTGSGTDETALLDGFIITGGHASEIGSPHTRGGGMYISKGAPTVTNCTFRGNMAAHYGGGMEVSNHGTPTVSHCTFIGNSSYNSGGGMSNWSSNTTVTDCTFIGNAARAGSGLSNFTSNPVVTNCTFIGNSSRNTYAAGGGMINTASRPTVVNCTFDGNRAANGGGMYNEFTSSPTITLCMFTGNVAVQEGGGMINWESSPTLTQCTFNGNSAGTGGGGMYNYDRSRPVLTNCILWGDVPSEIGNSESSPTVSYSNIQGGWQGVGNIDADPLFVPGPAGCFYLSQLSAGQAEDSPCVDAGNDTAANLNLDTLTTKTDEAVDTDLVDMGYHYPVTGLPLVMGDYDRNQIVNLADFAGMQTCLSDGGVESVPTCCRIFDFEPDDDVDLYDFAAFEAALSSR